MIRFQVVTKTFSMKVEQVFPVIKEKLSTPVISLVEVPKLTAPVIRLYDTESTPSILGIAVLGKTLLGSTDGYEKLTSPVIRIETVEELIKLTTPVIRLETEKLTTPTIHIETDALSKLDAPVIYLETIQ